MNDNHDEILTTKCLMKRWKCSYTFANQHMHRKGSGAFRVGNRLKIPLKKVIAWEKNNAVWEYELYTLDVATVATSRSGQNI